ncbi:NAD(P)-dependent dehydrogenase, short-chain alcohol dehydrogenase family [Pseudorhodobacter antarcticus]|uniref:NAD(P)-dependent dehydrogenase, short-chain alcohol dehydrogenase family n=1 Tax=Pseudorhodobacter antarcticus TaxID=1077947 RepID=A0A1H8B5R3_9RHOB|nr:SDR family NAD(P)-dependent oxidoreductase [Pseudorhodobacter antarcticus]SEM78330.1 NAD(P)-dependent dehydrogenase, short-chain alcohol dehydrogenase family [Pseudorhodobacter antarcticus]
MAKSLVIGASGGIGAALVAALGAQGISRSANGLDVTDEASIKAALAELEGPFDTVFIATGALEIGPHTPEKALRAVTPEGLRAQFDTNALGPILLLKHLIPLLPRDTPARIGILSARVGSIGDNGMGGWYSYRTAKAALNQLVHTAAIELARTHKQAVLALLHPGTVATDFTAKYVGNHPTVPPEEAAANLTRVLDGLTPAQTGGFYDFAGKTVPW